MRFILNKLKLSRQAMLFDSYLYVAKGFLSILTGYLLFHNHSIIGKDMISLLFAMMLTLEPVNILGIKTGFDQIKASILGGLVTAALVSLFGINMITIPLGVALTMYFSLKLNWRFVSPVAIFTAIYMTQYIQLDASGDPSMLITFRLRMLALGGGIGIAIIYNYIFSLMFHNSMLRKRLIYIVESLNTHMDTYLANEQSGDLKGLKTEITGLFSDIDMVIGHVADIKRFRVKDIPYERYGCALSELRDYTHYFLDVIMFRLKHSKGAADLEVLKSFKDLLTEIQILLESKGVLVEGLKKQYTYNLALDIEDESYLDAMHKAALGAAKCFIETKTK